jgi:tricorn protease
MRQMCARLLVALLILLSASVARAQIDARMFRHPDVSATHIAFVYAGDIWIVPKAGGLATRLTSAPGEELFPRFSPDGSKIAFSASYDGNLDAYVVPTMGGSRCNSRITRWTTASSGGTPTASAC